MKRSYKKMIKRLTIPVRIFSAIGIFLFASGFYQPAAAAAASEPTEIAAEKKKKTKLPELAEIIPLAAGLSESYTDLQRTLAAGYDISLAEKDLAGITARMTELSEKWNKLQSVKEPGQNQLIDLRAFLRALRDQLRWSTGSINKSIQALADRRKEWTAEKKKWDELHVALLPDIPFGPVQEAFTGALDTINRALKEIDQKLEPMLVVEQRAAKIRIDSYRINAEIQSRLTDFTDFQLESSKRTRPLLFTHRYYTQFNKRLWADMLKGLNSVSLPDRQFLSNNGLIVLLQVLILLALGILAHRYRQFLENTGKWQFVARRPYSAVIIVGLTVFMPFYQSTLPVWNLASGAIATIAVSRLVGGIIADRWKKRLIYGLAFVVIFAELLHLIGLPLPVMRLYIFLVSAAFFIFSLLRSIVRSRRGESSLYIWILRLLCFAFLVVLGSVAAGYSLLAFQILTLSIQSIFIALIFWILRMFTKGGVDLLLRNSPLSNVALVRKNASIIAGRAEFLINVLLVILFWGVVLTTWKIYAKPIDAIYALMAIGFTAGEQKLTLGLLVASAAVFYGAFLISWTIQAVLMQEILPRKQVEAGVQLSISRLIHYAVILLGFVLALMALGFELTNLTILGGALGIGIGFGLQAIVNNFASGLIMLFERPIKVGDTIELDGRMGRIKKLGLRATVVQTFDNAEIVVPNSDLITGQVTNWTLAERLARIRIPVGVAYGSDIEKVMRILKECAEQNATVVEKPEPNVLFLNFGASSLDFELRVWMNDFNDRRRVQSELNQEIDRRFREADIEIPFPQRDLHLRSVDESVTTALPTQDRVKADALVDN
jgi:small-conductance mechanosensitive channel